MNKLKLRVWGTTCLKFLWIIPIVVLLGQVMYLTIWTRTSQQVVIAIQGYDPRSLLSGHYINYQIDWDKTDCWQFEEGVCPRDDFRQIPHRFYVPQKDAGQLDRLLRFGNGNAAEPLQFEIVFAYEKGRQPIAKTLLINGEQWKDYLSKNY